MTEGSGAGIDKASLRAREGRQTGSHGIDEELADK
jgi:hypothetical protein